MREIKFRSWDKEKMMMGGVMQLIFGEEYGAQIIYPDSTISFTTTIATDGHEIVLMQYTGLKDKTGKDIYEGDYIKWEDYIGLVKFCLDKSEHYAPAFYIELEKVDENSERYSIFRHDKNYKLQRYFASEPPVVEIIGNVYETPELLKKD